MRTLHLTWSAPRWFATLFVFLLCFGPAALSAAAAGLAAVAVPPLSHGLQNMKFAGPLAVDGAANPVKDVLTFEDGKFSSQACLSYGFTPAPYWVRRDARGLHFHADLESPDQGTMEFEGIFDGEKMLATAHWTKKRWYWTIEQDFHFSGYPLPHAE